MSLTSNGQTSTGSGAGIESPQKAIVVKIKLGSFKLSETKILLDLTLPVAYKEIWFKRGEFVLKLTVLELEYKSLFLEVLR